MALAIDALKSARVYLNDLAGITWSDSYLIPLLQEAFGELSQQLDLNQVGVMKYESCPILVPAGNLDLSTNQPKNILDPISMLEKPVGSDDENYEEMLLVDYLPKVDPIDILLYWAWRREKVMFVGATADRIVIIRYKGFLTAPVNLTDPLGIIFAERFLGPRVAALAYNTIGRDSTKLETIAEDNLYKILQRGVLEDQRPVRRRPYREPKGKGIRVGTILTTTSTAGSSNVNATYQRTMLIKNLTIGNNVFDNVAIWGPNGFTGPYKAVLVEAVLRNAISQDLTVRINNNGNAVITVTIPQATPILTTLTYTSFTSTNLPNNSVFTADILASDGVSVDPNGIASVTILYVPVFGTGSGNCGQ